MTSGKKAGQLDEPSAAAIRAAATAIALERIRVLFPKWTDEEQRRAAGERWREYRTSAVAALQIAPGNDNADG